MIPNEHHLNCAQHQRKKTLRLSRLGRFVDQHLTEPKALQAWISRASASACDDLRVVKNLSLGGPLELDVFLLIDRGELALIVLQLLQLPQLRLVRRVQAAHLAVQRQRFDEGLHRFAALRAQPHHTESRRVDFLGQLVHCDVRWRTDQRLALTDFGEMVDDGR